MFSNHGIHSYKRLFIGLSYCINIKFFLFLHRDQHICRLCNLDVESEEHFIFTYPVYYEIRGRYYCLFRDTHTLKSWINYEDQRCIALCMSEWFNITKELLSSSLQRITWSWPITSFFQPREAITRKCQGDHKDTRITYDHRL